VTSFKNGGGGLKVTWSYGISGGSFTTNGNGSRDPSNQWRTWPSKLFLRPFQTSSRIHVSPSLGFSKAKKRCMSWI